MGPLPEWSTLPSFLGTWPSCGPLCATGISSGADGRVSRLRLSSPSAIAFSIPSLLCVSSAVSQCTGAVGRVSRPRSRTSTFSLSCISSISLFSCMRFTCNSSRFSLLKVSSGVVRRSTCIVRLVSFAQLSWKGQVGRLPSYVQCIGFPQGLVVLAVSDSADFKLTLRRACLEG